MALPDPIRFNHMRGIPGVIHGIFPRTGGISNGPCAGLNIGLSCGDREGDVIRNRQMMLESTGCTSALFLNQVHGSDILVLKKGMDAAPYLWDPNTGKTPFPAVADGVITDIPDIALVIQAADCQSILLLDPVRRVIAGVHSGWRGSVANIIGKCVETMAREFSCSSRNILAGISPSLGPCCAEFINYRSELPETFRPYKISDRPFFDFWKISADQLNEQGVKKDHIEQTGICTACNTDRFFSYRREKATGRFATLIALTRETV